MRTTYYTVYGTDDDGHWVRECHDLADAIHAARHYATTTGGGAAVRENRWSGSHWMPGAVVFECEPLTLAAA